MKFTVELLAFGKPGETREVEVPDHYPVTPETFFLQNIFYHGQNEHQPQEHPSVSAGDVIGVGDDKWLIMAVGFHKLTPEQYAEYLAMKPSERLVVSFFGFGKPV